MFASLLVSPFQTHSSNREVATIEKWRQHAQQPKHTVRPHQRQHGGRDNAFDNPHHSHNFLREEKLENNHNRGQPGHHWPIRSQSVVPKSGVRSVLHTIHYAGSIGFGKTPHSAHCGAKSELSGTHSKWLLS